VIGRRLPVVAVLVGLLVAAVAAGDRHVAADAGVRGSQLAASIPERTVRSSAWYCSGGPVGAGPSGDRVTISNVGSRPVRVAVDVMVPGRPVGERLVKVSARSSATLSVARLSRAPAAAVVVQPLGGDVVVEQGYEANGDVASAPCATRPSSSWYFASGSSVAGAQQWLSLFDPFAVDAVVDVEAYTESGVRTPAALQGLVVRQRSRLAVRVDRAVAEQKIVAVAVKVRNGSRIVATQALTRLRSANGAGVSLSLGALAPAHTWTFADNRSRAGAVQQLVIADPGEVDANVRVSLVADISAVIEPRMVRVPATGATAVDFSGVVPAGASYTLVVHSPVPVVAETRDVYPSGFPGFVTEVGSPAAARGWSFAGGPFTATGLGGGRPRVPAGFQLAVVMDVGATAKQIGDIHTALVQNGHVARVHTVKREAALAVVRAAQRNNPAFLRSVTSAMMPVSFDVVVKSDVWIAPLKRLLSARDGVSTVVSAGSEAPPVADDVVVLNPGTRAVTVSLVATARGSVLTGQGMSNVIIAPLRQATISLVALERTGAAVVVHASAPVIAERFTAGPWGVTRSPGVPAG
jgi:hypothetical protein